MSRDLLLMLANRTPEGGEGTSRPKFKSKYFTIKRFDRILIIKWQTSILINIVTLLYFSHLQLKEESSFGHDHIYLQLRM